MDDVPDYLGGLNIEIETVEITAKKWYQALDWVEYINPQVVLNRRNRHRDIDEPWEPQNDETV